MMRILMAILLVGLLTFNLACGPSGGGEDAGNGGETETTEPATE